MTYPIAIIDAFTNSPFKGNQAAICLLNDAEKPDIWMQNLAAEMNLSETAFLTKAQNGAWGLRWFTPTIEVNLCGHATLAAAHALWELHGQTDPVFRFITRSGELSATKSAKTEKGIELDFPATEITNHSNSNASASDTLGSSLDGLDDYKHLLAAFGLSAKQLPETNIFCAGEDLLVMLDEVTLLEELQPLVEPLSHIQCRGIIVTAAGGRDGVDFTSRFFAPNAGITEDPVTGSAHCALASFWAPRLNKKTMRGYQASARGGYVGVTLMEPMEPSTSKGLAESKGLKELNESAESRVLLEGQCVTVITGQTHA
ncbi:MAG: PhzF family phenazine biosynthesis protein [Pseudomonadales bacterium]|nr:PhzF family phenazine biosynthesis protein [Pseudomonadales bacterium]